MASSPAIFHSYADAHHVNPGAYDSPDEWARYDVTARAGEFTGLPVRIAIGAADPFAPAVRTLRDRLSDPGVVQLGDRLPRPPVLGVRRTRPGPGDQ